MIYAGTQGLLKLHYKLVMSSKGEAREMGKKGWGRVTTTKI